MSLETTLEDLIREALNARPASRLTCTQEEDAAYESAVKDLEERIGWMIEKQIDNALEIFRSKYL